MIIKEITDGALSKAGLLRKAIARPAALSGEGADTRDGGIDIHATCSRFSARSSIDNSRNYAVALERESATMQAMRDDLLDRWRKLLQEYIDHELSPRGESLNSWCVRADVSEATVREFLAGGGKRGPTLVTYYRLAAAEGIPISRLIEGASEHYSPADASTIPSSLRPGEREALELFDAADPEVRRALLTLLRFASRTNSRASSTKVES